MTSRPTPPAGDGPARRASCATSCTAICVVGSVSRRSWSASSITRRLGMPPPHESHHLPAAVVTRVHVTLGVVGVVGLVAVAGALPEGDGMPDGDLVGADEDVLDEQAQDTLALGHAGQVGVAA